MYKHCTCLTKLVHYNNSIPQLLSAPLIVTCKYYTFPLNFCQTTPMPHALFLILSISLILTPWINTCMHGQPLKLSFFKLALKYDVVVTICSVLMQIFYSSVHFGHLTARGQQYLCSFYCHIAMWSCASSSPITRICISHGQLCQHVLS